MNKIKFLLYATIVLFGLNSCEKESIVDENISNQQLNLTTKTTECTVSGDNNVAPESIHSYNYSTPDFAVNSVQWSTSNPSMVIINGQGTSTITVEFLESFTGGTLIGDGFGTSFSCADPLTINKCNPPTTVLINQTSGSCQGDKLTFTANPDGDSTAGSYSWSISNGSIISGQGTRILEVQSPPAPNSAILIEVTFTSSCDNISAEGSTIANYFDCDSGGF